ncbi:DUF881 domain-containing protein [Nocardioides sp. Soil805]|uniref:DUF881 domain-containing protein n=1 Tax=Nocardioides sp. Soil805 TaxID=1736416 RepID=UPI0007039DB7|nr:DUF881 domain-containing protein [Nocardioides sp. Soil805]KRF32407.1 hypothetical protein ASG94_18265 [Nocardioides sp. Soil805]
MPDLSAPERPRDLPEHVTTPLLALITTRSMDEDYAHVARRRTERGESSPARRRGWTTLAVVGTFGLLVTVAAVQTSRDADVQELGRATLISKIDDGRDEVAALQREIRTLNDARIAAQDRNDVLAAQSEDLEARVRRVEVRTGFVPVRGEGVRITVTNPQSDDPNDEIRDEDLATLVDGLWQAGAEAIAINGIRLTALSGIRNTGRAILVNSQPLTPPYVVEAIGDNATLQARLLESSQGQDWFGLVNGFGFGYEPENVTMVRLPASTLRPLRDVTEGSAQDQSTKEEGVTP